MKLKKRAEQFLLDKGMYNHVMFLNKVMSNTTNSNYFYYMGELKTPFKGKTIKGYSFKEYHQVVCVRISDHKKKEHMDSTWYGKNRVISSDEIDFVNDIEEAKQVALNQ